MQILLTLSYSLFIMCGITGYINTNFKPVTDTSTILSMLNVQKHRGPDDSGIRAFSLRNGNSVESDIKAPSNLDGTYDGIIGFNRLSILDLSINGHQPMISPDGNVILTLNGEIYNAFDYKIELEQWGYKFKSKTDTEIALALYIRYGFEGMLQRLNGMFAIVIVDIARKEVFITRDRFGIKPMYYISDDNILAFSSELKSFKYLEGFDFELNEEAIDEYLLFRNNLNGTLFRNINSLTPGCFLSYRPGKGVIKKRYFDINNYTRSVQYNRDIEVCLDELEEWLGTSVQSQLMSDVKLGCQLSGGIDSSLVTWLANKDTQKGNFEGVSIVFKDPRFNEESFIDHVQGKLGMPVHKFLLNPDYYFENIESATWHLETPINHPNTIGIYKLSQMAKEYVTVLLSGEGADEVFGGYGWFYDINYPFRGTKLFSEFRRKKYNPIKLLDYFNSEHRAVMATSFMLPGNAGKMYSNFDINRAMSGRKNLYSNLNGSSFDRQIKYELQVYMPDLLIRQDKMSMAHSIENRVPFLDNRVVENSFTIPEKYLIRRRNSGAFNTEKYILKKLTGEVFGDDFAFRKKMGFGIPLRNFFMDKVFFEYLNSKILPGIKERGIFDYKLASGWLSNIVSLNYSEIEALWILISFEIWATIYLDGNYANSYTAN